EDAAGLVPVVIVQIRSLPGRAATFVSDKGETWVQTDNQRQLPAVPFKASIKPGSFSSLFLVPDDYAHSFRVRPGRYLPQALVELAELAQVAVVTVGIAARLLADVDLVVARGAALAHERLRVVRIVDRHRAI